MPGDSFGGEIKSTAQLVLAGRRCGCRKQSIEVINTFMEALHQQLRTAI